MFRIIKKVHVKVSSKRVTQMQTEIQLAELKAGYKVQEVTLTGLQLVTVTQSESVNKFKTQHAGCR